MKGLTLHACIGADIINATLTAVFVQETLEERPRAEMRSEKRSLSKALQEMFWPEPHLKGYYVAIVVDAFACGLGFNILYGMLVKSFGLSTYQLGLLSATFSLSLGAVQIPFGKLTDRYGRKCSIMVLEIWKRRGQVEVSRDRRGRFVSWHRIFGELVGKRVAVYGRARVKGKISSRRIEFYGSGKDLHHAVALALDYPPRQRFVTVSAKKFASDPFKYCGGGDWIDEPEVDS